MKSSEDGLGDDELLNDGQYLVKQALSRHPYSASAVIVFVCSALVGRRRFHYALLVGMTLIVVLDILKQKRKKKN